ncbi:hypothetical protein CQW23_17169 [Capsicum baccatum]|uniref:Uncharacterized protein n=1 Tax=Capsicum baccatum TaxID=33114 RepID=A0A2G2WD07_CAPBA|nr:hypothetical protein CQW23_17169 [Capsicum baccatum]
MPLSLSCTDVQCARAIGKQYELKKVDVTVKATAKEHNTTIDNPSTVSKEEEKVEPSSSGERKNYTIHSGPSSEIQKLDKILPTYLDMSDFLDQKVRTDWSTIEAYQDKIGITIFLLPRAEYLSDGLQVPNDEIDAPLLCKRYASLLWKYREAKAQKPYARDIKDPRRSKPNFAIPDEEQLIHIE